MQNGSLSPPSEYLTLISLTKLLKLSKVRANFHELRLTVNETDEPHAANDCQVPLISRPVANQSLIIFIPVFFSETSITTEAAFGEDGHRVLYVGWATGIGVNKQ